MPALSVTVSSSKLRTTGQTWFGTTASTLPTLGRELVGGYGQESVVLVELGQHRLRAGDATVAVLEAAFAAEGFGAHIEDDLVGDPVADHCGSDEERDVVLLQAPSRVLFRSQKTYSPGRISVIRLLVENSTVGVEPALTTSAVIPTPVRLRTAVVSAACWSCAARSRASRLELP